MFQTFGGHPQAYKIWYIQGTSEVVTYGIPWYYINLLTPNVNYSGRTAPLTSKVPFYIFIQQI